jgi:hypothetical protein
VVKLAAAEARRAAASGSSPPTSRSKVPGGDKPALARPSPPRAFSTHVGSGSTRTRTIRRRRRRHDLAARKRPSRHSGAGAAGRASTRQAGSGADLKRAAADTTSHTEFELNNDEIETALQTGEHAGLLEDYFGRENYLEVNRVRERIGSGVAAR